MSADSKYYQFDLSLLSLGSGTPCDRLNTITSYCAIEVGWPLVQKMSKDERLEFAAAFPERQRPNGFNHKLETHLAIIKGFEILNMNSGACERIAREHSDCVNHINAMYKIQGGASPKVRVRSDILWDALKGEGFDWRQFTVLCAVYSAIGGHKNPWQVTRDSIRARALGYKKASLLFDDDGNVTEAGEVLLARREDKEWPLSTNQVRWTLDQLEARTLFARCHVSARRTYFSHRMTAAEMREWFKQNPPARTKLSKRLEADAKLRAEIALTNRAKKPTKPEPYYSGESPKENRHAITTESPHDHHNVTASVTTSVTTKIEALHKTPSIEASKHMSGACASDSKRKKASEEFGRKTRDVIDAGRNQ